MCPRLNADGLIIEFPENTKLFIFLFSASPVTNFIITQAKHSNQNLKEMWLISLNKFQHKISSNKISKSK